ncbi:hypothetical protein [Trueperella abortisuis]|uniref:hypothetical protein n=1 Tax=Trueperella abortisuis TaxID=445930 RepID=UPI0028933109|nr:hypothetical protein [Trueperella abortisuis]
MLLQRIQEILTSPQRTLSEKSEDIVSYILQDRYADFIIPQELMNSCVKAVYDNLSAASGSSLKQAITILSYCTALLADNGFNNDGSQVESIWFHAGSIVVSPYRGCSFGCVYCFRPTAAPIPTVDSQLADGVVVQVHDELELLKLALRSPKRIPGVTQLCLHSATTDPFLPTTRMSTRSMLMYLEENSVEDLIILITKAPLSEDDISFLSDLKKIRIALFLDYTGADGRMERMSGHTNVREARWRARDRILEERPECVALAHYCRPVVEGWNDTYVQIADALRFGEPLGISVIGGLVAVPGIETAARARGLPLPAMDQIEGRKVFPATLEARITAIHEELQLSSILVKDQACALTLMDRKFTGRAEANTEAIRRYDDVLGRERPICMARCDERQIEKYVEGGSLTSVELFKVAGTLGIDPSSLRLSNDGRVIYTDSSLSASQRDCLVAYTRVPVIGE